MMKTIILAVIIVLAATSAVEASGGGDVWYSVLFPGIGQIKSGRYGRGTLLMGAEMISLVGLVIADIQYDRSVEQYERAKAYYLNADYIGDATENYNIMLKKWDDAEKLDTYRKVLVGAAVGVWVLGILDMVISDDPENMPVSLEYKGNAFLVTKTFSF
ncbi:MAG: hypothetical protein JSV33_07180 [bacterium]|nr:MAG: hypothetical protein JSV33_07180 [bacterium]